jgi:hypothetical protein
VAFLRFSRDKRGYEHFYLVQPPIRGKGRPRVLYWFRTPPNIKVGRAPLDPEIQRALESQNPDVAFDWKAIARAAIPPPVASEHWREHRRAERAMRAAVESEQTDSEDADTEAPISPDITNGPPDADDAATYASQADSGPAASGVLATSEGSSGGESASHGTGRSRHRRRRRRKRQRGQAVREAPPVQESPQVSPPAKPEDGV